MCTQARKAERSCRVTLHEPILAGIKQYERASQKQPVRVGIAGSPTWTAPAKLTIAESLVPVCCTDKSIYIDRGIGFVAAGFFIENIEKSLSCDTEGSCRKIDRHKMQTVPVSETPVGTPGIQI